MGCFTPDAPAPVDYSKQTRDTLQAQIDLAPQLYSSEAQYQPKYAALSLQNMGSFLNGSNGQPGFISQYAQAMPALGAAQSAANTAQRTADIRDVNALAPQGIAAMRAANPGGASILDKLTQQANEGLDAGSQMTGDQMRNLNNSLRSSMGARGVSYGPASSYAEALAGSQYGDQLSNQRQSMAASTLGATQSFYGDPYQQILGRSSGAGNAAGSLMNSAQGAQSGPQIFNPESALSSSMTAGNQQMAATFAKGSMTDAAAGMKNITGSY
jgi:hypothetical protein